MKKSPYYLIILSIFIILAIPLPSMAQEPDLSKLNDYKAKINIWLSYCESLRLNSSSGKSNFPELQRAALKGITLTLANDAADRSRFFFYAGFGCYYQVKFDSAQYYLYKSLYEAERAK